MVKHRIWSRNNWVSVGFLIYFTPLIWSSENTWGALLTDLTHEVFDRQTQHMRHFIDKTKHMNETMYWHTKHIRHCIAIYNTWGVLLTSQNTWGVLLTGKNTCGVVLTFNICQCNTACDCITHEVFYWQAKTHEEFYWQDRHMKPCIDIQNM